MLLLKVRGAIKNDFIKNWRGMRNYTHKRVESYLEDLPDLPRTPSVESPVDREFEGKVVAWIEEKGFGFIESNQFEGKVIFESEHMQKFFKPHHGDTVTFDLGPKHDELSFTEIEVVFGPGKLGMRFEWDSGIVRQIIPRTQSAEAGLRMGCKLKYVDGELYDEKKLRAKLRTSQQFNATFTVPIRPSFTGSATNSQAVRVKAVDTIPSLDEMLKICSVTSDDLYGPAG